MFKPRRWPFITIAIIAVNLIVFLVTHGQLQQEASEHSAIESRTLEIVAAYPQVPVTAAQQTLIDAFRHGHSQDWELMASRQPGTGNFDEVSEEMAGLASRLDDFQRDSLIARFALYPPHRSWISPITANFLHGSWIQLLFNICFLWLAGGTLEDVWGREFYGGILAFCALSGTWAYNLVYPNSLIPLVGSTGMVAALMGAYLIRFPKTTIERGTALWVVRPRLLRFSSPVYVVFPMWLLGIMFWGKSAGETTNVAYWALAGAFANGFVLAIILLITGLQLWVTQKIDMETAWSVDPHIADASDFLQSGDVDSAIKAVSAQIAEKPASVEAHEMLVSLYLRKGNVLVKYLQSLESLCEVQFKAANPEAAWAVYETYLKAGGRKMPAWTWFQLARFAENQADWPRALTEYEEFAHAWPDERNAVLALISAGRIQLQHCGKREEAVRLYTEAQNSTVPHSDWDEVIRKGIEKSKGEAAPKAEKSASGAAHSKPGS